jgi:protein TonB
MTNLAQGMSQIEHIGPQEHVGQQESKHWIRRIVPSLVALLLLIAMGLGVHSLLTVKVSTNKPVTTIKIMPDMPPPPPPKEQPKEQPKEIKIEQPKPQEAPQPAAEVLKMEGAAGNGDSPFAAGAVKNDYIGGKGGLAAFRWYTDQIKTRIEEALAAQKDLVKVQYRLNVHVWVARDGRVERAELQGSSGDASIDKLIRLALSKMKAIAEAPPEDMPQPVKLRITSKNAS